MQGRTWMMIKYASIIRAISGQTGSTSETSVNFYKTTRRNNPEGSQLNSLNIEMIKSY
jgi:hypothetical protein